MATAKQIANARRAVDQLKTSIYDEWDVRAMRTKLDAVASQLIALFEFPPRLVETVPRLDKLLTELEARSLVKHDLVDDVSELISMSRRVSYGDQLRKDEIGTADDLREDIRDSLLSLLASLATEGP